MGFKTRRAKRSDAKQAASKADEFRHSSGASNLEAVLGDHTLHEDAEATAPKGYRGRTIKSPDDRSGHDPYAPGLSK